MDTRSARRAGLAAIAGAGLAILGNAVVLVADPAVADDLVSYPLTTTAFAWGQVGFAVTQALMAWGVWGLVRSGAVDLTRRTAVLGVLAVAGMALTVPGELALIAVAAQDASSGPASAASSIFGLGVLLADLGLIGIGILALRQRHWPLPWAALPSALGAFQLLVVTPVSLSLGFASLASFLVIGVADALTALIGLRLLRDPAHAPMSSAVPVGR